MDLPYQAISEAEGEDLAQDLAQVALSAGDKDLSRRITATWGPKRAAAGSNRVSDVQAMPDG